jgi:polyvinyl alcohol dehydrogenase (cytochrome)
MRRLLLALGLIALASPAGAVSQYLQQYLAQHPGATTGCQTCHQSASGGLNFNVYGTSIRSFLAQGQNITAAIYSADGTAPVPVNCVLPQVNQGGVCVTPPPKPPVCVLPQVLQAGQCVTPTAGGGTPPPTPGPAATQPADGVAANDGWPFANRGITGNRYAATEHLITPANVGTLAMQSTATTSGSVLATPTVQGGYVYAGDKGGNISKYDAKTGRAVWTVKGADLFGSPTAIGRTAPAISGGMVVMGGWSLDLTAPSTSYVAALDQQTGAVRWKTLIDADQGARIMQSAIISKNIVYIGVGCVAAEINMYFQTPGSPVPTCRGSVVALQLVDGRQLWKTYTVPVGYSGGGSWSDTAAIDAATNTIFAGVGNTFTVPPAVRDCIVNMGGGDVGTMCDPVHSTVYNDSLIALDMRTGAIKWGKKVRSQDTYDVAGAPDFDVLGVQIYDTSDGKKIVGTGHKNGSYIALDRNTGDTLWVKNVGSASSLGGIERSCATDGVGLYCPVHNFIGAPQVLLDGTTTSGGYWTKFDAATGKVLWQVASPGGAKALSPMTLLPTGVVFGCSLDPAGKCYALSAADGHVLKELTTGASNGGGVAVFNGRVYIGNGYDGLNGLIALGGNGNSLMVYSISGAPADPLATTPTRSGGGRSGSDGNRD